MSESRFDRTIRTVMWLDAFLSVTFVAVCVFVVPVVAAVGVPSALSTAVLFVTLVSGIALGVLGPVYAVLLMVRMHRGDYLLPRDLRLPLPSGMSPDLVTRG